MAKDLTALFCPKSVAIIGASRTPDKVGAIVLKNIISSGFTGKVYPVNPNVEQIGSLKCYPDISSLPEVPDLAVIAIPAASVLEVLTQVGEKGIKNAVIFSAGFKETGEEGKKLEEELINIAQKYNINVLGPNCLGFVNNLCPINVTFGEVVNQSGNLRFISQSGALATSLFDWCKSNNLGFSQFITLGNKAVINENDVLEYFQKNQSIGQDFKYHQPTGLYLESISQGTEFLRLTTQITKTDPIFILKPGKTSAASKAMQSHTGAIAGEDAVLEAVLAQAGIIRAQTLEEFFDLSRSLAWQQCPNGDKVAIISNAGGPAVIAADSVAGEGLTLAEFDTQTHQQLVQILPRSAGVLNPVDVLGDALADRYAKAAEIILQNSAVNALVVILTPQIMTQIKQTAAVLGQLAKKYQKPIFCSFIGGSLVLEGEQELNKLEIPSFSFPEQAIWVIGKMWQFKKYQKEDLNTNQDQIASIPNFDGILEIINKAANYNQKTLDNLEANELICKAGISAPPTIIVANAEEAKTFAKQSGYPVVLKLSSPGLLHKKRMGGVITNIESEVQLEAAWVKITQKITSLDQVIQNHTKIQIQKDVGNGVEVIIGVKQDPNFGLVLLFGAGGSLAEVIGDRNLHLLPVNKSQVIKLVRRSKIFTALSENSGNSWYALDKLYEAVFHLGQLAQSVPQILEIEINPLIVTAQDVWAVDCKVII